MSKEAKKKLAQGRADLVFRVEELRREIEDEEKVFYQAKERLACLEARRREVERTLKELS